MVPLGDIMRMRSTTYSPIPHLLCCSTDKSKRPLLQQWPGFGQAYARVAWRHPRCLTATWRDALELAQCSLRDTPLCVGAVRAIEYIGFRPQRAPFIVRAFFHIIRPRLLRLISQPHCLFALWGGGRIYRLFRQPRGRNGLNERRA